jgi:MFS family permease
MGRHAWGGGMLGLALGFGACVVLAFAETLPMIGVGFAMAGAAMALTQYDFAWMLVRLYHPHSPRRVVTGITLFGALASSIMWPVAQFLNAKLGLTWGWVALGAMMLVVGALCLWLVTHQAVGTAGAAEPNDSDLESGPTHQNLPTAQMRALALGLVVLSVVGAGLAVNLPQLLHKAHADPVVISFVLSLFGIGQLAGRVLDFVYSAKFGLDRTIIIAVACSLVSWTLLMLPQGLFVTAGAVLLMGASNGLFTIVRGATPQLMFHGAQFTVAAAMLSSWGSYARAAAPFLVAWMVQALPAIWPIALVCALSILLGAWAVLASAHEKFRQE